MTNSIPIDLFLFSTLFKINFIYTNLPVSSKIPGKDNLIGINKFESFPTILVINEEIALSIYTEIKKPTTPVNTDNIFPP